MVDINSAVLGGGGGAANRQSQQSLGQLTEDFGNFLHLLTTQLRNQDPLSPLETHEFTNQLVLFAGVEQQIRTNSHLEEMSTATKLTTLTTAQQLVGKTIGYDQKYLSFDSTGALSIPLHLSEEASSGQLQIFDKEGSLVYQLPVGALKVGENEVTWDGNIRRADGSLVRRVSSGEFTVKVLRLKDADGNDLGQGQYFVDTTSAGRIASVAYENDEIFAVLAGSNTKVPFSNITDIADLDNTEHVSSRLGRDLAAAAQIVGREIDFVQGTVPLESGQALFRFETPSDAHAGNIYVVDLQGRVVHRGSLSFASPDRQGGSFREGAYEWNGQGFQYGPDGKIVFQTDAEGNPTGVPQVANYQDGEFQFALGEVQGYTNGGRSVRDVSEAEIRYIYPTRTARVEGAEVINEEVVLTVGEVRIPFTAVSGVREATATATVPPTPSLPNPGSGGGPTPAPSAFRQLPPVVPRINPLPGLASDAGAIPGVPFAGSPTLGGTGGERSLVSLLSSDGGVGASGGARPFAQSLAGPRSTLSSLLAPVEDLSAIHNNLERFGVTGGSGKG